MPSKVRYAATKAKRTTPVPMVEAEPAPPVNAIEVWTPEEQREIDEIMARATEEDDPVDEEVVEVPPEAIIPSFTPGEPEPPKAANPADEPGPQEYITLVHNASYGPVTINGRSTRCSKGILYYVPDVRERADILGTGLFRSATKADVARSLEPSSGPGKAVTRAMLPPGALKGGLQTRVRTDVYPDEEG